jgi:hypothetical protein
MKFIFVAQRTFQCPPYLELAQTLPPFVVCSILSEFLLLPSWKRGYL